MKPIEIRYNEDGTIDEIVAGNAHLEQMSEHEWSLSLYTQDEDVLVSLYSRGRINVRIDE